MNENRLRHSFAVANKMVELNKGKNSNEVFLIGYLHDIGYQFTDNRSQHNKVGGEILKNLGFTFWKEIYYHGEDNCDYQSEYLDLLNSADMMIDSKGNDVGFENRLEDIKNRYGEQSIEYIKANNIIKRLRKKR